jgi:hypothetical protein
VSTFRTEIEIGCNPNPAVSGIQQILSEVQKLRSDLASLSTNVSKVSSDMEKTAASAKKAQGDIEGLANSIRTAAAALGLMWAANKAFDFIKDGLMAAWQAGSEFNQIMEVGRIGMAAMFTTLRTYTDEHGRAVEGERAFAAAMQDSYRVQELMQSAVFKTNTTLQELQGTFSRIQMGAASQKATTEEMVRLTVAVTNMATATGRSPEALSQQLSLMMNGIVRAQGAMGGFIKSLGLSTEEVKKLAASGDLLHVMLQKMDQFERAGGMIQQSYQGVMSNVKDVWQQLSGAFAQPLMDQAKILGTKFIETFTETWVDAQGNTQTRVSDWGKTIAQNFGSGFKDGLMMILETVMPKFDNLSSFAANFATAMREIRDSWRDRNVDTKDPGRSGLIAHLEERASITGFNLDDAVQREADGRRAEQLKAGADLTSAERALANQYLAEYQQREESQRSFKDRMTIVQRYGVTPEMLIGNGAGPGDAMSKPTPRAIEPAMVRFAEGFKDFKKLFSEKMELGGLEGVEKQFQQIDIQLQNNIKTLDGWEHKLQGKTPEELAAQGIFKTRDSKGNLSYTGQLKDEAEENAIRAKILLEDQRQEKLREGMLRLTELTKQTLAEQISAEEAAGERKIAVAARTATAQTRTLEELHAVWEAEAKAKEALFNTTDLKRAAAEFEASGEWDKLVAVVAAQGRDAGQGFTESFVAAFGVAAEKAYAKADDMASGVAAGLQKIRATYKTEGKIIADTMSEVWGQIGDTFANVVSGSITNGIEGIKGAFKGLVNSLLNDWVKMIKDMAMSAASLSVGSGGGVASGFGSLIRGFAGEKPERYLYAGMDEGGDPTWGNNPNFGMQTAGYVGGSALKGYGVGGAIGGMSGAPGWNSGATIGGAVASAGIALAASGALGAAAAGAVAGSVIPVLGTIIGAVIGGIIGILSSPNTEMKSYQVGKYSQAAQVSGQAMSTFSGSMLDLYGTSASAGRDVFAQSMSDIIKGYMQKLSFKIHAGSNEDLQKDFEQLTKGIIPAEILHQMFGQGRRGGKDYAGIDGGSSYTDMVATDAGPLTKWMKEIGFSIEKINEITGQIDQRGAEAFQQYLVKLVGVVISFNNNIKNLSKTSGELFADASKSSDQNAIEAFHESAVALTEQAKELSQYSGDDQIARAQKLNDAVAARYQQELQFIQQIIQTIKSESAAFLSLRMTLGDATARSRMTSQQYDAYRVDDWKTRIYGKEMQSAGDLPIFGYRQQIMNTQDPATVIELAAKARDAIKQYFDYLNNLLSQNLQLLSGFKDLKANFGAGSAGLIGAAMPDTSLQGWLAGVGTLKTQVTDAAKLTGQAQIDAMKKVQQTAAERYQQELGFIRDIKSNLASFKASIAGFKENIKMDGMNDQEKATYLASKLRDDEEKMRTSKDPAEIKRLQDEIMQYAQQYYGLFKEGDPRRAEAGRYISDVLDRAAAIAEAKSNELIDIITEASNSYAQVMQDAADTTQETIDTINAEIGRLNVELGNLETAVRTKLKGVVDTLVADNTRLAAELAKDADLFTKTNAQLTNLTDPTSGTLKRTGDAFDGLSAKARALGAAFDTILGAGGSGGNSTSVGAQAYNSRTYSYAFSPATGV